MENLPRSIVRYLRHDPTAPVDAAAYVEVSHILGHFDISFHHLEEAVLQPKDNQRLFFSKCRNYIRAAAGHTITIHVPTLSCQEIYSPDQVGYCCHGTSRTAYALIKEEGLKPMTRQYVHFASSKHLLKKGSQVIITLNVKKYLQGGMHLFRLQDGNIAATGNKKGVSIKMAAPLHSVIASCLKTCFNVNPRDFQTETIHALVKRQDVFLATKTGGGKSLCYQGFPSVWKSLNDNKHCMVLIVTPLLSIMREQCQYLKDKGYRATYIGRSTDEDQSILSGHMDFVFSSPESLLSVERWRSMLSTSGTIFKLLVIDEAHTVLQWGEDECNDMPFRSWYGKLGEVRSLISCPILLMTATSNRASRKKMKDNFSMVNPKEIIDNPDRENIKLFVKKITSSKPLNEVFLFLIEGILKKGELSERYIIYCPSIKLCSDLYTMFRLELKDTLLKHIDMFHSKTTDKVKEAVKEDMSTPNGKIRILIATSAAGMGVNFQGVNNVINYGPPKDMDTFVQQFGRAGRAGGEAMALLLYNGKQCKNLDLDMKDYINNTKDCRRSIILHAYNAKPEEERIKHLCCDICSAICNCGSEDCSKYIHPYSEYEDNSSSSDEGNFLSDSDLE